jgi:hypothetical protein
MIAVLKPCFMLLLYRFFNKSVNPIWENSHDLYQFPEVLSLVTILSGTDELRPLLYTKPKVNIINFLKKQLIVHKLYVWYLNSY